jgi:hypothetical protein
MTIVIDSPQRRAGTVQQALLLCGIVSSLLYVVMCIVTAMRWPGYHSASQTVSELSAIGAPTRAFWVPLGVIYTTLVIAFGLGVRASADRSRSLRTAAVLIAVYGALGVVWPFAPMHLRDVLAAGGGTMSDTLHLALGMITVLLMLLAIGFAAAAFGREFRLYSIMTIAILLIFGALTGLDAPSVGMNRPTPWVGIWERINIGAFLLWIAVLAVVLFQRSGHSRQRG